jgi:hypothetical protein
MYLKFVLLLLSVLVGAQAKQCEVQLKILSGGIEVYSLDVNDPEQVWIKEVFTNQIQSILEGVDEAGLTVADGSENILLIDLDYLRSEDSLIQGIELNMKSSFENQLGQITQIDANIPKQLSYLSRRGLKKSSKKLTKEIEKTIFGALKILQRKSDCL